MYRNARRVSQGFHHHATDSVNLMEQLFCADLKEWQKWLRRHHRQKEGVWLIFYRQGVPGQELDYGDCLDEALCWGWIDSLIKKIDDTKYVRKFTPRNPVSKWSTVNKNRVQQLIQENRMQDAGHAAVQIARENGCWERDDRPPVISEAPIEWQAALQGDRKACETFHLLAATYQKRYNLWIATAKKPETREKRIREALELLGKGQKLPLK